MDEEANNEEVIEDTHVIITPVIPEGQQQSSSVSSGFVSNMLNLRPDTVPTPTTVPRSSLQDLPNFSSLFGFDHRVKTLETDFFKFKQMNQFAEADSSIPGIIDAYLTNKMNEAFKIAIQLQSDKLRDEALAENEALLNSLDENINKIIKDQVKQQVKVQVSKILPRIEKTVNEQLEVEVMTRASTESKTSLAIAANLSKFELKKILIDKMESNKSIHRSDEQKNLYKALVKAYESDKLILDTYGDTVSFKRRRDDEDKDEEPSARSNRGQLKGPNLNTSRLASLLMQRSQYTPPRIWKNPHIRTKLPTPDRDWNKTLPAVHGPVQPWLSNLAREEGPRKSFDELMDTPLDFSAFMMNRLKIDTLTPELLTSPTFELMKDYGHIKWIEDLVPNTMWSEVPVNYDKHALWGISHWGGKRQQFYRFAANRESARDVYSKRRIITVIKLQIIEWHGYKHLDWITIRIDDDKLYAFKEGDFKWLLFQDIKDMLILLVQGKLTNLNVEDRLAFGVSLRMFTRSIVIQRRVKDL
ncbi:hypothetical protein Tco_0917632 [Tanacetum coccineum]